MNNWRSTVVLLTLGKSKLTLVVHISWFCAGHTCAGFTEFGQDIRLQKNNPNPLCLTKKSRTRHRIWHKWFWMINQQKNLLNGYIFWQYFQEWYLEPNQKFMVELFNRNSLQLLAVNFFFAKKAPLKGSDVFRRHLLFPVKKKKRKQMIL